MLGVYGDVPLLGRMEHRVATMPGVRQPYLVHTGRERGESMTDLRKLHTNGSSTVVSLSNTARNELGVESGDYVKVLVRDGEVILRSVEGL